MSRRLSRTAALALAVAAIAAPAAQAQELITPDARDAGRPVATVERITPDARDAGRPAAPVERITPDARDAGRPAAKVDLVSPDARDNGRREPAPIIVSEPVATGDAFDWFDAGVGAAGLALLVLGYGAAITLRTRRHTVGA